MTTILDTRPESTEYGAYYGRYIERVPEGDLIATLEAQRAETGALLAGIGEERSLHRYEPGKWSIREVVGHVADAERIFAYRALRIARGDETPLPGFEQNDYVRRAGFDRRTLRDLAAELDAVRHATLHLARSLDDEALSRRGTASDLPISARALFWIIAGHERHHLGILRERYLGG
jgi:uncharacterized damage-inducible protein DinB